MNIQKLFHLQHKLDKRIEDEHGLENADLFDKKILALLVELGELANETRCFKFWSKKKPSKRDVILEEYVDGIHFILSLGIELNMQDQFKVKNDNNSFNEVEQFHYIYELLPQFRKNSTFENYSLLFNEYLNLGNILGFTNEQIEQAYIQKNEVNHQRQDEGY